MCRPSRGGPVHDQQLCTLKIDCNVKLHVLANWTLKIDTRFFRLLQLSNNLQTKHSDNQIKFLVKLCLCLTLFWPTRSFVLLCVRPVSFKNRMQNWHVFEPHVCLHVFEPSRSKNRAKNSDFAHSSSDVASSETLIFVATKKIRSPRGSIQIH